MCGRFLIKCFPLIEKVFVLKDSLKFENHFMIEDDEEKINFYYYIFYCYVFEDEYELKHQEKNMVRDLLRQHWDNLNFGKSKLVAKCKQMLPDLDQDAIKNVLLDKKQVPVELQIWLGKIFSRSCVRHNYTKYEEEICTAVAKVQNEIDTDGTFTAAFKTNIVSAFNDYGNIRSRYNIVFHKFCRVDRQSPAGTQI